MKTQQITDTLNTMSRDELRAVASKLGVKPGKDKANTVQNLTSAIEAGNARFTIEFTIREKGTAGSSYANSVYRKKLRTHKPDKVLFAPAQPVS